MAENKVVNTTQLEADLTSVADAIRAKAGSSDSLAFPDGFAEAIASIGGLPDNITHLATGTYTFASDTAANTTITHNLGVAPHFFMFVKQGSFSAHSSKKRMVWQLYVNKSIGSYSGTIIKCCFSGTSTSTTSFLTIKETGGDAGYVKPDTTVFTVSGRASYDQLYIGGDTFTWICGRFDSF